MSNEIEQFIEESKKDFRTTGERYHKWKEWRRDDRIILFKIMIISNEEFKIFLNRQSGRHNFDNEKGCVIPLESAKEVSYWMFMQTEDVTKYNKGTGEEIIKEDGFTWELIRRIKIKDEWGDTGEAINLKLMHSKYGEKIFLQNQKELGGKNKRGVEIPYDLLLPIVLEIRKFVKYFESKRE